MSILPPLLLSGRTLARVDVDEVVGVDVDDDPPPLIARCFSPPLGEVAPLPGAEAAEASGGEDVRVEEEEEEVESVVVDEVIEAMTFSLRDSERSKPPAVGAAIAF